MVLEVEYVPTSTLRPHPDNPRNGDTDAIADSLRQHGQYKPIVVTEDGTILAGNHTYMSAMELGWQQMAVVRLPLDPQSIEARKVMAVDNRTSDLGTYDPGGLVGLLTQLNEEESLLGTGYDDENLKELVAAVENGTPLDFDDHGWARNSTTLSLSYDKDTFEEVRALLRRAAVVLGTSGDAQTVMEALAQVTGGQLD